MLRLSLGSRQKKKCDGLDTTTWMKSRKLVMYWVMWERQLSTQGRDMICIWLKHKIHLLCCIRTNRHDDDAAHESAGWFFWSPRPLTRDCWGRDGVNWAKHCVRTTLSAMSDRMAKGGPASRLLLLVTTGWNGGFISISENWFKTPPQNNGMKLYVKVYIAASQEYWDISLQQNGQSMKLEQVIIKKSGKMAVKPDSASEAFHHILRWWICCQSSRGCSSMWLPE